jgi:hypothetical protein
VLQLKKILENFKNLEKHTYKIMKNGFKFCFILCVISIIILFTYELFIETPFLYHIGMSLFKLSLVFGTEFIICGFIVDGIKKQMI